MRSRPLVLALTAALALALLASGCGGGGSSSTTAAKQPKPEARFKLTKGQFISQGDAICAEVNTAIGSLGESAATSSSQATQVANLYVGMVQSLQRLGQPREMDGYSDFMGAAEELAKSEGEVKSAAERENAALLEEASQQAVPAVEGFQSQAATYGFEDCAEGPHAPATTPRSGSEEAGEGSEESGGVEVAPEEAPPEEEIVPEEEAAPEEAAPETGGAGGAIEEAPERPAPETGGESGGIGPG